MRRCRPAMARGFSTRWRFRGLAGRVIVSCILFTLDGQRTVFNEKEADGGGRGGPRLYLPLSPLPARGRAVPLSGFVSSWPASYLPCHSMSDGNSAG